MTATPTSIARQPDPKVLMHLGDQDIQVEFRNGRMRRWRQTVRLYYGPHLYSAGPFRYGEGAPTPHDDAKVVPFEPGYSALVAGMGGRILIPPVIRDEDGKSAPNPTPLAETSIGSAYRWSCLAVCVLRHPVDGSLVVSTGRSTVDARSTLVQGFLSSKGRKGEQSPFERPDVCRLVADDTVEELRKGECKGWVGYPTGAGITVMVNPAHPAVREKISEHVNLMKTIAQQAQTKAGRIAADRNPLFRGRCVWRWDQLREELDAKGGKTGRRYVDVVVHGWAEEAEAYDSLVIQRLLENAAEQARSLDQVIDTEAELVIDGEPESSLDPDMPQIEQLPEEPPQEKPKEREPVKTVEQPRQEPKTAQVFFEYASAEILNRIAAIECELSADSCDAARHAAGLPARGGLATQPRAAVVAYLRHLSEV